MCAINGITKNDRAVVTRMNELTQHRGPDGSSLYADDQVTLGHNRLAIIDTSDASLQPMTSVDGRYVIVFNGELYNFKELRDELKELYEFKTVGDTEVLLAAYCVWKEEMFSRLRGMFAFAIWDTKTQELLLARDHMGVKPLYYMLEKGVLTFSSEIPALLAGMEKPVLDMSSLAFYLGMEYVPGPQTLVRGIVKMRPGQCVRFKHGVLTKKSFLPPSPPISVVSSEHMYETIDAAVKRHMISDRPIGAYLSGGFDSSIVVHHMTKYSPHTRTYSVDFEAVSGQERDSVKFNDDARLAETTAKFYGTEHKKLTISIQNVRDTIERASMSANEPIANSTAITQFLLSDFVRRDGTVVVLGGDGGDELFGGYTRHRLATAAYLYQKLPVFVQKLGAHIHPRVGKLSTPFGTPLHRALMVKDEKILRPFLARELESNATITHYFNEEYARVLEQGLHPVDTFMRVDRHTWLPDECFVRSDYASMAHGVELRVPFVDIDVVDCADRISIWKKTLPHEGKRIIRHAYKSYLPPHLYQEPKRGWLSPAAKWFRDPVIGAFSREVFSSGYYSGLDGVFDWAQVQQLLDDHIEKRGYHLYPLWNILVLQVWARAHRLTALK